MTKGSCIISLRRSSLIKCSPFQAICLPYSESGTAIIALAEKGLGIAMFVDTELDQAKGMEKLLPDFPKMPIPIWLVTHRELHTSRRIRLVYDHLSEELKALLKG